MPQLCRFRADGAKHFARVGGGRAPLPAGELVPIPATKILQCVSVVEAEWPDGTIEKIEAFKYEAADWIVSQSEDWLQERVLID
jgi:hypothetical protein